MKALLLIFLFFLVLVCADPCPSDQSCTYTNTGGDCSAGDECTFTLTSQVAGRIIRCGSGACNVVCSGFRSCDTAFIYSGSGPVTVTCSGYFSCLDTTMAAGSGSFNVQCAADSGCYESTINGGSGSLTIGFLVVDSGTLATVNGGSGPLDVTCSGIACSSSILNAGTGSTTVHCLGGNSCVGSTYNIGSGWFSFDCLGNPAQNCFDNEFNQQNGALLAPDVPAYYYCTDNKWQCSPDLGNPDCVADHCDCPQFSGSPSCVPPSCPVDSNTGNATWDVTLAPATGVVGTCNAGFAGAPTRDCESDGSWSAELGGSPCVPACPAQTGYGHASWPATPLGQIGNGVCDPGYNGTTQRKCNADGSWASLITTHCQRLYCPVDPTSGNANWPRTSSLTWRVGTCNGGIVGTPHRFCGADGNWGSITQPCITGSDLCPQETYNRVLWSPTQPGTFGTGACLQGSGSPSRYCDYNGHWVSNLQTYCV